VWADGVADDAGGWADACADNVEAQAASAIAHIAASGELALGAPVHPARRACSTTCPEMRIRLTPSNRVSAPRGVAGNVSRGRALKQREASAPQAVLRHLGTFRFDRSRSKPDTHLP
jgi:hypothetical protein